MLSNYWEQVRHGYAAFESDMRSGASEVYVHGMPGGQYTNLREQARSLGIDDTRWHEVARAYAQVNEMFGDIVKVTPSSKVVGDMAIMMVTSGLTAGDVLDPDVEVAFPGVGRRAVPRRHRPAVRRLPARAAEEDPRQRAAARPRARASACRRSISSRHARELQAKMPRAITDHEFASWLMYPKVFTDYMADRTHFGDVSVLPTRAFFYGLEPGEEITIDLEKGKHLIIRYVATSDVHDDGTRTVFFELNGQPRSVKVHGPQQGREASAAPQGRGRPPGRGRRADAGHDRHGQRAGGPRGGARRRAGDDRGDEDGDERARRARRRRSRRSSRGPGSRSMPRTCWWCWNRRQAAGLIVDVPVA